MPCAIRQGATDEGRATRWNKNAACNVNTRRHTLIIWRFTAEMPILSATSWYNYVPASPSRASHTQHTIILIDFADIYWYLYIPFHIYISYIITLHLHYFYASFALASLSIAAWIMFDSYGWLSFSWRQRSIPCQPSRQNILQAAKVTIGAEQYTFISVSGVTFHNTDVNVMVTFSLA